ncbi:MAG TPA: FHA domain-containing protein [Myxococcaceae bacterium]|nr:FHA domain-containing protein [Myxococcaceae bacterium]
MAEKMIRCAEGHFFDPSKHTACPWCALPADAGPGSEKTRPLRPVVAEMGPPPLPGAVPPPPVFPPPQPAVAPAATRRLGTESGIGKPDPVVGWLVVLDGPDRGRDYRLHSEKNFIGRAPHMDVCIASDDTVSRERHGVIIFDPKKQVFWVLPGDSSGLVYLNGEIVHSPSQINRDDVLEIGHSKLVLIPFCGEKYSWASPPA